MIIAMQICESATLAINSSSFHSLQMKFMGDYKTIQQILRNHLSCLLTNPAKSTYPTYLHVLAVLADFLVV